MHFPTITIDYAKSEQIMDCAKAAFGDVLNCRRSMKWHWADDYLNQYVARRGMEEFMCNFVSEPEWVQKVSASRRLDYPVWR